jgi:glycosyltransferase involved in cell wall biosynthesis
MHPLFPKVVIYRRCYHGEMPAVGVVVPTIGERPQYLDITLKSIREAGDSYIVLVGRKGFDATSYQKAGLVDLYIDELETSVPNKINQGFRALPENIEYITWIGDDDLLAPGSLSLAESALSQPEKPVLVFGHCQYIDSEGNDVLVKRSGSWAVPLLRFGPQLIPQPSAVFRRDAFEKVGGLSDKFEFAFDFDLFLKLSKLGKAVFVDQILSSHRWHATSLTYSRRWESVKEAGAARVSNLSPLLRALSFLWEIPIILITYLAGNILSSGIVSGVKPSLARNPKR